MSEILYAYKIRIGSEDGANQRFGNLDGNGLSAADLLLEFFETRKTWQSNDRKNQVLVESSQRITKNDVGADADVFQSARYGAQADVVGALLKIGESGLRADIYHSDEDEYSAAELGEVAFRQEVSDVAFSRGHVMIWAPPNQSFGLAVLHASKNRRFKGLFELALREFLDRHKLTVSVTDVLPFDSVRELIEHGSPRKVTLSRDVKSSDPISGVGGLLEPDEVAVMTTTLRLSGRRGVLKKEQLLNALDGQGIEIAGVSYPEVRSSIRVRGRSYAVNVSSGAAPSASLDITADVDVDDDGFAKSEDVIVAALDYVRALR